MPVKTGEFKKGIGSRNRMPNLTVKMLTKKDAKLAHDVSEKVWNEVNNARHVKWVVKYKKFCAYLDGKVVGLAVIKLTGGAAYLTNFVVARHARKQGAGTALLNKYEDYAKRMKCHVAVIETSANLPYAVGFYERHGYKTEARLKNNRFHTTVLFMTKALKRKKHVPQKAPGKDDLRHP